MKQETWYIAIDDIGRVFGGLHGGYYVEASIHAELNGREDGFETVRVPLDADRLIIPNGYNSKEILSMVREHVGETVVIDLD
jgi:hypothetical protein